MNSFCEGSDSERFPKTRYIFDENVTVGNESQKQSIDELLLANNEARELRLDGSNAGQIGFGNRNLLSGHGGLPS